MRGQILCLTPYQNTNCTEILAGLRFEKDLIRQLLQKYIMRESVIYQDIVQKEAFKLISRQLNRRFSELDSSLIERVRKLSAEQLEDLTGSQPGGWEPILGTDTWNRYLEPILGTDTWRLCLRSIKKESEPLENFPRL
jgi:Domain of unknown function (DUF4351)